MYAWKVSEIEYNYEPFYVKGERTIDFKNCIFPSIFQQTADSDNTEFVIVLMTEYYKTDKTGMMRIKLKSDYTESVSHDEE